MSSSETCRDSCSSTQPTWVYLLVFSIYQIFILLLFWILYLCIDPSSSLLAIDVDLNHVEPWDLPCDMKLRSQSWYLFSFQSRRYGRQPTRSTAGSNAVVNEVSGGKNFNSARATWHVASAACHHMTGNKNLLTDMVPISDHHHVDVGDGSRIEVPCRGSVKTENIVLHDVWYVPGLTSNLVSASQLSQLDLTVGFSRSACQIKSGSDGSVVGRAHSTADGMFELEFLKVPTTPS